MPGPVDQNPAGLNASLIVEYADGRCQSIRTGSDWRASQSGPGGLDTTRLRQRAMALAVWSPGTGDTSLGCAKQRSHAERASRVRHRGSAASLLRARYAPRNALRTLRPGATYTATRFDPVTGQSTSAGEQIADASGESRAEPPQQGQDWVLLLKLKE